MVNPDLRLVALAILSGPLLAGCSVESTRTLPPQSFALTADTAPYYSDGELELYRATFPVELPLRAPTEAQRSELEGRVGPFPHQPWVTADDVGVIVTFTLANLDRDPHDVKILVDPWNEFGRYVPGFTIDGDEALPNRSGFEELYRVPGVRDGAASRLVDALDADATRELATDFATVIQILDSVDPPPADSEDEDPRVVYANHTFALENHRGETPLTDRYTPEVVPALLGFDVTLETTAPANVACELTLELIDREGEGRHVLARDDDREPYRAPRREFTVGSAP